MKTAGILLLFALCTAIGMRAASRKTERYRRIGALIRNLHLLSEAADAEISLQGIAKQYDGELFSMLQTYLNARSAAAREADAASAAAEAWKPFDFEYAALLSFFTGLSTTGSERLHERIRSLERALSEAEQAAAETAKQAKTIRAVGVLAGVGLCILLL